MTKKLYDLMNWADVEEVTYAESTEPKRILGPHLIDEGLLIQAFIPTAVGIQVKLDDGKKKEMELADEAGFFAVLIPINRAWNGGIPKYTLEVQFDDGEMIETADPYAFASELSEEDIKKYQAGISYDIYRFMGAHEMTIDGVAGVNFVVWAPNAMRVSVVGDFNLWDGRRNMMQRCGGSGIYELFIPGLKAGTLYKYEIKCHGQVPFLKTDPYGFAFELRPNTASIVCSLDGFKWHDAEWQKEKQKNNHKERPMSVYEVHLGSFFRKPLSVDEDGTEVVGSEFYNYREIAAKLADYVHKEGYTHVELMPVMEHPLDQSWGYQVSGYYAPTSRYGTPEDFMFFMDYMHAEGIGVILDWVPAHFPRDAWGLAQFDGSSLYEDPDPNRASHPHWGTLIFHYARNEVSNFLIGSAMFWADVYHADAIRMDAVASMLYLDYGREGDAPRNIYGGNENLEAVEFLKHLNSMFHKKFPGTLLIGEESTAWPGVTSSVEDGGLGFDIKWNMGWMNDFTSYMETDPFFRKNSYSQLTFSMLYNYSEDFMLVFSHDEVVHGKRSMLAKMPGQTFEEKAQNLRAAYGYFYTHPGKKLLFMGQDFGQYDEWSEAHELEWNLLEYPVHATLQKYVADMNQIYKAYPALWKFDYYSEGFEWINCTYQDYSMLIYVRKTDVKDDTLLIVSNFDNIAHPKFRVGVPFMCSAKPLISSDEEKYGGQGTLKKLQRKAKKLSWDERDYSVEIDIPAMSTTIYQLTPMDEPVEKPAEKPATKSADKTEKATSKQAAKTTTKSAGKTAKSTAKSTAKPAAKSAVKSAAKAKPSPIPTKKGQKSTRSGAAPQTAAAIKKRRKG